MWKMFLAVTQNRFLIFFHSILQFDICSDFLAIPIVFKTNGNSRFDSGRFVDHFINFQRGQVYATAYDQLFQSAGNKKEWPALIIFHIKPFVAASKPTVFECFFIGFTIVVIAYHHIHTSDHNFTAFLFRKRIPIGIVNIHLIRRDRNADARVSKFVDPFFVIFIRQINRQKTGITGGF